MERLEATADEESGRDHVRHARRERGEMQRRRLKDLAKGAVRAALAEVGVELRSIRTLPDHLECLRGLGIRTVLDVGANTGQFVRRVRRLLPEAAIHAFEPLPTAYASLARLAARDPLVTAHAFALGESDAEADMQVNVYSPSSSLLRMNETAAREFPYIAAKGFLKINVRSLDRFAQERRLEGPIFVKLDVQGFEDRVVRGGSDTLARAVALLSEVTFVPLYEGQVLFTELYAGLRGLGFHCAGMFDNIVGSGGRILQSDALFLRGTGE